MNVSTLRRFLPVAILLLGLALFLLLGLGRYFSFEALSHNHAELTAWVAANGAIAALGAIAVFLAARTAFYDLFHARAGAALARFEQGFRRDSFSYLLFLRLIPVFPFWLVNIVPALLGMTLGPYTLATLIGIIPGAVVYSSVGSGLGTLLDRGEMPNLGIIFEWRILLPLLGLAVLA